jgi:hypothetical protein
MLVTTEMTHSDDARGLDSDAPALLDKSLELSLGDFEVGFWHPVGPHGREALADIIPRKRRETERNGWTLWSFQYRTPDTLAAWHREASAARGRVLVLCSSSGSAIDPGRPGALAKTDKCRHFRLFGHGGWLTIPDTIEVPHPFKPGISEASAFVVQHVYHPIGTFERPSVRWFSKGNWREDAIPTRPEYLIRRGGITPIRSSVMALLELRAPYLAIVRR